MSDFSLILGGGSARGLAHIGVIRRLEELDTQPSLIVGTSIGALIGAMYACGHTSHEMGKIAKNIKLLSLIDPDILKWGIKGKKIVELLKEYFWKKTFGDTSIPLRIVATNIDTGEKVVFSEWKIIDAIRASISIPWVFVPYAHAGMHLVDGGITANLPIEEAQKDSKVIAISVQMSLDRHRKNEGKRVFFIQKPFVSTYLVLRKAVSIMITQNEKVSVASRPDALFLKLGRNDIDYYDFKKVEELVEEGYKMSKPITSYLGI